MRRIEAIGSGWGWFRGALALSAAVLLCGTSAARAQEPEADPAAQQVAAAADEAALSEDGTAALAESEAFGGDLSVWGMFMEAGLVVKAVMLLLLLASVWNVTVFLEKSFVMSRVNRQADKFIKSFRGARSLDELSDSMEKATGPMARMFAAGMQELTLSSSQGGRLVGEQRERVRERVGYTMGIVQSHETRNLGTSMSLLATIGSTAPFIGLFGTVWGIMTSFIGIAQAQTTNLAVVAPGIAEALLATAIGLAAAIPAVMLYNKFSRDIGQFSGRLQDFSSEFAVVMSRELDRREVA